MNVRQLQITVRGMTTASAAVAVVCPFVCSFVSERVFDVGFAVHCGSERTVPIGIDVVDSKTGLPISGAKVRLSDCRLNRVTPSPRLR